MSIFIIELSNTAITNEALLLLARSNLIAKLVEINLKNCFNISRTGLISFFKKINNRYLKSLKKSEALPINLNFKFQNLLKNFRHLIDDDILLEISKSRIVCENVRELNFEKMSFITPLGV